MKQKIIQKELQYAKFSYSPNQIINKRQGRKIVVYDYIIRMEVVVTNY